MFTFEPLVQCGVLYAVERALGGCAVVERDNTFEAGCIIEQAFRFEQELFLILKKPDRGCVFVSFAAEQNKLPRPLSLHHEISRDL